MEIAGEIEIRKLLRTNKHAVIENCVLVHKKAWLGWFHCPGFFDVLIIKTFRHHIHKLANFFF